jgi:hypothetical protein
LIKLGLHHVRDSACAGCVDQRQALLNLAAAGIKTDFGVPPPGSQESLTSEIQMLSGAMRTAVDSIEGPNEYDNAGITNWVANLRPYQQELYQLVRASPTLADVPVLGPSMAWRENYAPLGDLSAYVDQGNIHAYPGGQLPDANLDGHWQAEAAIEPGKPLIVTESGYNNAVAAIGGHPPVSEAAAAAYIPRLFLDYFRAGVTRTYLYELIDEWPDPAKTNQEANFGLLRNDYSEKPSYLTLQTLLSSLAPTATPFTRSSVQYQTPQAPADLRQLLLQTGANRYALVLWRNASLWDIDRHQDLTVARQPVTLTFPSGLSSLTDLRLDASQATALGPQMRDQSVTVSLDGMPHVLTLQTGT